MISDLNFLETVTTEAGEIEGAAYASAGGTVGTGYGYATAGTYAIAIGWQSSTLTNTDVKSSLTPTYATSLSSATASASANDSSSYASVQFYGNSYYSGSGGISANMTSTTVRSNFWSY
ncbi:MAG: hypothetical protein HC866_16115 [Leptolyngbyaceae cyanobacterium RU_5_1]|nr:hypothetical protein [Leptolyngbyaceae cyanobacterium RU_5_1]